MFGFGKKKSGGNPDSLITAMCGTDAAEVARLMPAQDFVMIKESDESGGSSPLMLEVDGFPAVAAFTSQDEAAAFAGDMPEAVNADGSLPAFVVGGGNLLAYFPDGVGVIVNPGSEQCAVMAPDMVAQVKQVMSA